MTSIMLKAALVLLLALTTVSNATHDLNHERYNDERSKLGRLSDGLNVNTRALNTYLKSVNFTSRHLRALVKSLVQIQVFKDEQLPQHSDGIVHDAYEIILTAVVARSCNLLKHTNIVAESSSCSLQEVKRILTLLEMLDSSNNLRLHDPTIMAARGNSVPSCYCPWYNYEVLNNDCPSANVTIDILDLQQKCNFCTDQTVLMEQLNTCNCYEETGSSCQ